MALIKCIECGAALSDKAKSCLQCGAPTPAPPPSRWWLWLLAAAALFVALASVLDLKSPQNVTDANAAFVACKTLVKERVSPGMTMEDCDRLHADIVRNGLHPAK